MANTFKLKQSAVSAKIPTTAQLQLGELAVNTYDGRLFTKKNVSGTESIIEFVSDSGTWGISINGNAATATTLQTGRTINGTSFNGSANITTASWGTTRTLTIGNTGKSVDGSAAVTWSLAEIGAFPAAGGTMSGDLYADGASRKLGRFTVLQSGYLEGTALNFRFDQDCLRYANRWGTATITATAFTANELDSLFSQYASFVNLQSKASPCSIEITGFNIGSSSNPSFYPYVLLHAGNQLGSIKMEVLKSGAPSVWEVAYDGAIPSTGYVVAEYSSGAGYLIGVRWTFSGYTANPHYIRSIGCISRNGQGYAWNVMKGGDTVYGSLAVAAGYSMTAPQFISNVATGTAPLGVTSTTVCTNLNADLLDGYHVGSSGGTIPLLNTANTWSALQTITVGGNQLLLHPATSAPTVIFRNDGVNFYLLLSDAWASPSQTWNTLRPFYFNLTTGAVTIANGLTATLTGNASTATTLQTARTINGTSFNGSANITTANWGTARTLTIGNTGKSVDGSAAVSWSLAEIGALPVAGGTLIGALTINLGTVGTGLALSNCDIVVTGGSVSANYISADTVAINYDPVQPTDATSKAYVDAMAAKDACLVATFNPIPYGVLDSLTGTIAVIYTPFTFTSVSSNTITLTGHQFNTGDCIRLDPSVQDASNYLTVNGTARVPGNTANWYVIKVDANNIKISNTLGNAMSGSSVSITITGTVTVTAKIPAVIDAQLLSVGSRVLVRSQTSGAANGIYEVADNTINAWWMYRSPDADTWGALSGALVPVPGGTVNNDSLWICTNGSTGTINTTAVTFRALATAGVTYGRSYSTEPSISTTGPIAASRFIRDQGAPATQNTSATLTSTQVGAGILQTTPTAPITLTLPTGTTMEEIVIGTGEAYDLSVINTSANAVTIAANTGHTIVGNATIAANTSSLWCFRKTGANTFVAYRIS